MLKLEIKIEEHNRKDLLNALEHILFLIVDNHPHGDGWAVTGEESSNKEQQEADKAFFDAVKKDENESFASETID